MKIKKHCFKTKINHDILKGNVFFYDMQYFSRIIENLQNWHHLTSNLVLNKILYYNKDKGIFKWVVVENMPMLCWKIKDKSKINIIIVLVPLIKVKL